MNIDDCEWTFYEYKKHLLTSKQKYLFCIQVQKESGVSVIVECTQPILLHFGYKLVNQIYKLVDYWFDYQLDYWLHYQLWIQLQIQVENALRLLITKLHMN